jgi:hypothetical protein
VIKSTFDPVGDVPAGKEPAAPLTSTAVMWHQRLGHRNEDDMRRLGNMGVGIPKGLNCGGKCDVCEVSKHIRASFPASKKPRSSKPWELVYTDVLGPVDTSIGGARFAVMFTDDATRWRVVYPMKAKSDTLIMLKRYIEDMGVLMKGRRIKTLKGLRSDNGGEFTGDDFKAYCKSKGILQTFTAPHSAPQLGIAERGWRTTVGSARSMREQAGLPKSFWAEALNTAVYITNRSPTAVLGGETPYQVLFGKKAQLDHLRSFGCRAYAHYYDHERQKLDPKAWRGIMLGYDDYNRRVYRIYDPDTKKVHRTMHVTFDEESFPARSSPLISVPSSVVESPGQVGASPTTSVPNQLLQELVGAIQKMSSPPTTSPTTTTTTDKDSVGATGWKWTDDVSSRTQSAGRTLRSGKTTTSQSGDGSSDQSHYACFTASGLAFAAASALSGDPNSYEEAMRSPDADLWKAAIKEEYDALVKTGTWELCELPPGANAIGSRWVFKTTSVNKDLIKTCQIVLDVKCCGMFHTFLSNV